MIMIARHKGHRFVVEKRKGPGGFVRAADKPYNFKCVTCGTTASAMPHYHHNTCHWKGWPPLLETCGNVLARQVHES
jgi:hypothetical protein